MKNDYNNRYFNRRSPELCECNNHFYYVHSVPVRSRFTRGEYLAVVALVCLQVFVGTLFTRNCAAFGFSRAPRMTAAQIGALVLEGGSAVTPARALGTLGTLGSSIQKTCDAGEKLVAFPVPLFCDKYVNRLKEEIEKD